MPLLDRTPGHEDSRMPLFVQRCAIFMMLGVGIFHVSSSGNTGVKNAMKHTIPVVV